MTGRPGAPASCCVNAASPDDGDRLERRSLTGTARRRRANADLLHARMAQRRVPMPSGPGAVGGCGPPGRVPVRDRRSKPAGHQVAWGSACIRLFRAQRGAREDAHEGFSWWGLQAGGAVRSDGALAGMRAVGAGFALPRDAGRRPALRAVHVVTADSVAPCAARSAAVPV